MPPKNRVASLLAVVVALFLAAAMLAACDDDRVVFVGANIDDGSGPSEGGKKSGECGKCRGEVTTLTLRYTGAIDNVRVVIVQKCPNRVIFDGVVRPGQQIFIEGADANLTMGPAILVHVNDVLNARFDTSCVTDVGPGLSDGDFRVIDGASKAGGKLCPMSG